MVEENDLHKKFHFNFSEEESEFDVDKLKRFIETDKNAVIEFYGGEPLLEIEKIKEIIDKINVPFRMQTNGLLLDKLPFNYLKKIDKILVSLDGDKVRTDYNRGKGTYKKVISNIKKIKNEGYVGEIVARMCVSNFSDIFEQVKHLSDMGFSVHWQLDAGFYKCDYNFDSFFKFVFEYNKEVSKLIDFWIGEMEKGRVLKIYPFLGIVESLLKKEKTLLRCGAGHEGYAIDRCGKIYACPITTSIKEFEAGNLDSDASKLKKFDVFGRCLECEVRDLCGGRCLYWNMAGLWPQEGDELICKTIKHLIFELKSYLDKIRSLIDSKKVKVSDFLYEKYFGPEIIP